MRRNGKEGFLRFVPLPEAKRMIADPGTTLVTDASPHQTLHRLAGGKGLVAFYEPDIPEDMEGIDVEQLRWRHRAPETERRATSSTA